MRSVNVSLFLLTTAAFLVAPLHANAAAFYLQEQSTAATGSAFAGAGAQPRDASIMYYNPAGITRLKGAQVSGGASLLDVFENNTDHGSTTTVFNGALTPVTAGGGDSDDAIPLIALPNLYAATPLSILDDRLWAGIGFSVPFGLATKYDDKWFGRYDSIKSDLRVYDIQPTLAFQAVDWLSVGGGVNIQHAQAKLTNAVTNVAFEGRGTVKGDDWDVGYNLGLLATPIAGTNIGFDYRSRVDHTLDGRVLVTGVPAAGPFPGGNVDIGGTAELKLPDIYGLSVAQTVTPQWTVLGQVNYFNWSRFNQITVVEDNGTIAESIPESYRDTWSFALGAEYAWTEKATFRFGYQFDQTPTRSPFRDTRVPDGNRNNFAAGVSYDIDPHFTIGGAVTYSLMQSSNVDVTRNTGRATVKAGREDTSFMFGSLGLTYKF